MWLSIVERLAYALQVREASIQMIVGDDMITLAKSGKAFRDDEDLMHTRPKQQKQPSFSALGVDLPALQGRSAQNRSLRDEFSEGHVLLSRHGAPVFIGNVFGDWRFVARKTASDVQFFAGSSILSSERLPIGVCSVTDDLPRPDGLDREARFRLAEASRKISAEQRRRRFDLSSRLALLDESIWSWCKEDEIPRQIIVPAPTQQSTPMSIEGTLLCPLLPLAVAAPPSPNNIARRRRAKAPRSLFVPTHADSQTLSSQSTDSSSRLLQRSLRTIAFALQMSLTHIDYVSSTGTMMGDDTISCSIIA